MIQRIQTVYLILALALMSALFYFPIAKIIGMDDHIYLLYFDGLKPAKNTSIYYMQTFPLAILLFVICMIDLVTIFLYRKRKIQMRLCIINMVLMIGSPGLMVFYLMYVNEKLQGVISYEYPLIFPVVAAILTYLAFRGVRKDELLVRSLERIR